MFLFLKLLSLFDNYYYDLNIFRKYSTAIKQSHDLIQLEAKIDARYHNLEKGLSLKEVRLGFGKEKIELLLKYLDDYVSLGYDQSRQSFQTALSVLIDYINYHKAQNFDVEWLKQSTNKFTYQKKFKGGTQKVISKDLVQKQQGNFKDLAFHRHSIRNFSRREVSIEDLKEAIKIAQMSPSVCNRQSGRVHLVENKLLKEKILQIQKGNSGFGHLASKLLIVSSDIRTFTGIGERNQPYIDGSLFGMTLTYALHSMDLATCIMNWSTTKERDIALHKLLKIPEYEIILFLIAVGHYPDELLVAKSLRKDLEEIVKIH